MDEMVLNENFYGFGNWLIWRLGWARGRLRFGRNAYDFCT